MQLSAGDGSVIVENTGDVKVTGSVSTSTDGSIRIGSDGSVQIDDTVTARGTGNVTLTTSGNDSDIAVNALVSSVSGDIKLDAGRNIMITDKIATAGNVTLTAAGTITQSGSGRIEDAALLATSSVGGLTLTGAKTVKGFSAVNAGDGDIVLVNTENLTIAGIDQGNGDIDIRNTGDVVISDTVRTAAGTNVTIDAAGTISEEGDGEIVNVGELSTKSEGGQALWSQLGPEIHAVNTGGGAIEFFNTGALEVAKVTQESGDVKITAGDDMTIVDSIATPDNVSLTAAGTITETGDGKVEGAALLATSSNGGQTLSGANTVKSFRAANSGAGKLIFHNISDVLLASIVQTADDDVVVDGEGDLTSAR